MVHLMGQPAFAIDDFLSPAGQDQGVEIWLLDKVPRFNFLFASFCGQGLCPLRYHPWLLAADCISWNSDCQAS